MVARRRFKKPKTGRAPADLAHRKHVALSAARIDTVADKIDITRADAEVLEKEEAEAAHERDGPPR